jgi:2-amino-4-hydroxy-6-hydroxymethyldihydropteridine diphosphokinase
MNKAALLLGTNLGDRLVNLTMAIDLIGQFAGKITKKSSVYETAPWGNPDQDNFLNQAILVNTNLSAPELLTQILDIERKMGRERMEKWGPRLIDIDILYYNEDIMYNHDLKIPHPFLQDRRFALVALNELSPKWKHPLLRKNAGQMLKECKDKGWVRIFE